jgi:hypothetical protein
MDVWGHASAALKCRCSAFQNVVFFLRRRATSSPIPHVVDQAPWRRNVRLPTKNVRLEGAVSLLVRFDLDMPHHRRLVSSTDGF